MIMLVYIMVGIASGFVGGFAFMWSNSRLDDDRS